MNLNTIAKAIIIALLIYFAAVYAFVLPGGILIAIIIAGYIIHERGKQTEKKNTADMETKNIMQELDELDKDLDEHLAVDNSGGKVVRFPRKEP